ncbi:MAG: hypothetical protein JSU06_19030 [Actinobacteria bacterium]|nr:hypothetical protein [Actinomycetota bacterium]
MTASMAAFGAGNDSCPDCGARMAADQRYCLNCGHRRGDPRLPFMDAVVFMETMNAPAGAPGAPAPPPPPEQKSSRMNANAALIAGVATLVLAIGVGFLIGRSGHDTPTQAAAPQVIKVEGGGGGGETAAAAPTEESSGSEKANKGGGKSKGKSGGKSAISGAESGKATKKAAENSKEGEHGASEGVEKVLHTSNGVELETEVEVGGKCKSGAAGCEGGKFTGNFFGE